MHDLLSTTSSSRSYQFPPSDHSVIEMAGGDDDDDGAKSLAKYFGNVEAITEELNKVEQLKQSLKRSHEQGKTLHNGKAMEDLRFSMEAEVALALETAKFVRFQLEALERANADHRSLPGRGPGSSSDRSRTSVVISLWKKLKDSLDGFNELRHQINTEHRETVQRQYFTVTGNNPDDSTLDLLISSGNTNPSTTFVINFVVLCFNKFIIARNNINTLTLFLTFLIKVVLIYKIFYVTEKP